MPVLGEVEATLGLDEANTCYNGVLHKTGSDRWYFLHRRNCAERNGCGLDFLEGRFLDKTFSPLSPWKNIGLPGTVWEDPRIFTTRTGFGVVVGGPTAQDREWRRRGMYCAELALNHRECRVRRGTLRRLRLLEGEAECEKNWLPFLAEGRQLVLYSVSPLILLEVVRSDGETVWTKIVSEANDGFDFPGAPCSCGTVPVRVSATEFLTFFHSVEYPHLHYANSDDRSLRALSHTRLYRMGALLFSALPPFKLLAATAEPIEYPGMFRVVNRRVTRDDRVVFPASATLMGGEVVVAIGENDSCTKIVRFSLAEIRRVLRPAQLGFWAGVHSRPVPCDV